MAYEAVDVLSAVVSGEKKRGSNRSAEASPLLHAMRTDGFGSIPEFPRTGSTLSQAQSTVLERIAEMAERAAARNLSPTLSAELPSQAPSRRPSIDSTTSRATDRSHILHGFPQAYRDAFSGVPSVYAEYGRPLSRASSRSGYYPPYRSPTGMGSPVTAVQNSRSTRMRRQEMLAELTDSSDEGSPGKRRGRRSTRNVLRSLDLRASDMGSSSDDDSPSPRGRAPQRTKDARAKAGRDPHFTTSSTDEDRNRRRAWQEDGAARAYRASSSPAKPGADGKPSPNSGARFDDSGSGSDAEGGAGSESVLHSALSVVRGLEQRSRRSNSVDIDEVQDVEDYLAKSRGLTHSQRSSASPDTPKRRATRAAVAPAVQDMLEAAFQSAKGSPKRPSSVLLSASRSPTGKSPQVFSGKKDGKNFILQTVPAYGPAADLQDSIGLPVCFIALLSIHSQSTCFTMTLLNTHPMCSLGRNRS
jgi:hypothetical protein